MKFLLISIAGLASLAYARPKTDVLVMKNGDRITCEIKKLEAGVLVASLDYVDGNIAIDWQKVERIESSALFAVKLENGQTFAGTIMPEESAGSPIFEIQPIDVDKPLAVNPREVVGLDQASASLWRRFNGGITIGSQYSKGNSTSQYNLGSDIAYEESRWGARLRYNSNLSSSTGAETATRYQSDLSVFRLLRRESYFYQGGANYLRSSVQGIEKQVGFGGGLGYFFKNTNRVQWSVQGGPMFQRTRYVPSPDAPDTQDIVAVYFGSNLETFRFKKTRLTVSATMLPALNDLGRYFFRSSATYYLKLFGKIDWDFSAYINYNNHPPPHLQGSDYGSSTGFSYSFGNH